MPRPRLLWINQFAVLPTDGGGTRHFELGRELVERGWDVTVAASDFHVHGRQFARRASATDRRVIAEQEQGVDFRWLWSAPYEGNDWRRARNWWTFAEQARLRAASTVPDVVIGSSPQPLAALAGLRIARRERRPFVLEVRDLWPESLLAVSGRKGLGYHGIDLLMRRLYAAAARIVVLARGSAGHLQRELGIPADKFVYVPNGVDPAMFDATPRPARERFTIAYTGAHGPANGLEAVLGAAALLRRRPDIRFLLVGDGPAKASLVAEATARGLDNVEFRGSVPKQQMPRLLQECDGGLMVLRDTPLFAYGVSPNKLFDYLGAGLPVVCNVPGDVARMVADANAGVQAADGSAAALAAAVERLADASHAERARMSESGQAWVAREHGRAVVAERLDEALRPLLQAP